jgi:hypothetical protein
MDPLQSNTYILFRIAVPDADDPQSWAERMHTTYGFEYHTENINDETLLAWAFYSELDLTDNLSNDGIYHEAFVVSDLTTFFEL